MIQCRDCGHSHRDPTGSYWCHADKEPFSIKNIEQECELNKKQIVFKSLYDKKFNNSFEDLKEIYESQRETINRLRKEVNSLRNGDEENRRLREELKKAKAEIGLGFPVSKEEYEAAEKWRQAHHAEKHEGERGGAIGGMYSYEFTPTSIGTIGYIKCCCGDEFCFQEI